MTKRRPTKGTSQKKQIKKPGILKDAPKEHHFKLADGTELKSVRELIESLDKMNDELFREHVNDSKNDFSCWIKDIYKEDDLAKEIREVNNKLETQIKLLKHIVKKIPR